MMVSEEKRVPTNTHIPIVHGQGRQWSVSHWSGQDGRACSAERALGPSLVWHGNYQDSLGLDPHSPISGLLPGGILT